jgi:uncharacterized protein DUF4124
MRIFLMAGLLLGLALDAGASPIYRCSDAQGVGYQQLPCAPGAVGDALAIAESYPQPDTAARERLLQREAALDRRLEAQRERLSREEATRIAARAQVDAARAAAAAAQAREPAVEGGLPWVLVRGRPSHRGPRSGGRWAR